MLTGGNGQLARALCQHRLAQDFDIFTYSHAELDITDKNAITLALIKDKPDYVVNTAAYTAVDLAEKERALALAVNLNGTENLAQACTEHHVKLLHISTDYIFDGLSNKPIREDAHANPINYYGTTKWQSELALQKQGDQFIILRVSGVFSEYGHNFLKTMLRLANEKKELTIISDQIICPTYAGDIAQAIYTIIHKTRKKNTAGHVYHYCNKDPVSWYDFAVAIIEAAKSYQSLNVEKITAIHSNEFKCAAKRPAYSVLDCHKIEQDFSIQQTYWQDGVKKALTIIYANETQSKKNSKGIT